MVDISAKISTLRHAVAQATVRVGEKETIIAIKEKDNTITISGISAINFEKNIGFALREKNEKLRPLVAKVSGGIVCDTIRVGNQTMLINKKIKAAHLYRRR